MIVNEKGLCSEAQNRTIDKVEMVLSSIEEGLDVYHDQKLERNSCPVKQYIKRRER